MRTRHTLQSPGNEPVTYTYATGDALKMVAAVADLLVMDFSEVPESSRPKTLAITIEM